MFAQWQNSLLTHFSECFAVLKRRMIVKKMKSPCKAEVIADPSSTITDEEPGSSKKTSK